MPRYPAICIIGVLLTGCATAPQPSAGADGSPLGYWYHDAIRPNNVVSPSPQAIYNASHGVWLWPPKENGRRG
jgi:hypothetical protein